jgi:hypothetical protein
MIFSSVVVLLCQQVFPDDQPAPKCVQKYSMSIPLEEIFWLEPFQYFKCKSEEKQATPTGFKNCEAELTDGCKVHANEGEVLSGTRCNLTSRKK